MARKKKAETPEEIKLEQREVTRKYTAWHRQNPQEECRRIDRIDGMALDGVKYFYVSKSGKVISCLYKEARELKYNHADKPEIGYAQVDIYGQRKLVHRLVLETFKDYIEFIPKNLKINDYQGHHIDKTKDENGFLNNSYDNLLGLPRDIHTGLFNEKSIYGLMTDNKKSKEYMQKIIKYLDGLFDIPFILYSGETYNTTTKEYSLEGKQTIEPLKDAKGEFIIVGAYAIADNKTAKIHSISVSAKENKDIEEFKKLTPEEREEINNFLYSVFRNNSDISEFGFTYNDKISLVAKKNF